MTDTTRRAPDDSTLIREGLAPRAGDSAPGKGKILILACGALAHEILALIRLNNWTHLELTCLPAIWHNTPERIPAAVEEAVTKHRADYDDIFVAYADCGTGGQLQAVCDRLGVRMIEGPHCYSFFEGNARFADHADQEIDVFYLTLGLDRHPELMGIYFAHYRRLVYQAQTDNPELDAKARAAAEQLGLTYERRFTGYGDLERSLKTVTG